MKKINFKFLLIVTLILGTFFSSVFVNKVSAQTEKKEKIIVETTGYSVLSLSPGTFIFGGAYTGNLEKRGFTTYFEYKKNDSNLDVDAEETIKIVREQDVEEYNDFYTSPELNLFSTYYFRAVGYFNDDSSNKFYGQILSLRTGYIPVGWSVPFSFPAGTSVTSTMRNYIVPAVCNFSVSNVCDKKVSVSCTTSQVLKDGKCKDKATDMDCPEGKELKGNVCVDKPKDTTNGTTTTPSSETGSSGLVPCGTERDSSNKITNPCGFSHILELINKVVTFVLVDLALPIAALMFAYAGFLLATSGGNSEKKSQAKSVFTSVAIGLIIVAGAFTIVKTVLSILGYQTGSGWNWFGF